MWLRQITINNGEDGSTLQSLAFRREVISLQFPPRSCEGADAAVDMLAAVLGTRSIILAKVCCAVWGLEACTE